MKLSNVVIKKAPAVADEELTMDIVSLVQIWSSQQDWKKYKAIIMVDLDIVYFMVFDIKNEELEECYIAEKTDGYWWIKLDRVETWDTINNVVSLLNIKEIFDIEGRWD
jgi:hypothetical protein